MPKEIVDTHVRWGKLSRNIYCLNIEVHSCSVSKNTSVHIIWDWKSCPGNSYTEAFSSFNLLSNFSEFLTSIVF